MEPLTLGGRVIGARRSRKLTQVQLAERTGLTPAAICQIERDERSPMLTTATKIADALGVSLDYLVKGEGG